jgi:hypothetical protein
MSRLDAARDGPLDANRRERAALATGWCLTLQSRYTEALTLVEPLQQAKEDEVARLATRIVARARLGLGDATGAARALAVIDPQGGAWLLARDAADRGLATRAESLLARPVREGDLRPDLVGIVRTLWIRDSSVAWRIARTALDSRGPADVKSLLRMTAGELLAAAGRDVDARAVLGPVARSSLQDSSAATRARDLVRRGALRGVATIEDAETRLRGSPSQGVDPVDLAVLLTRLLVDADTGDGAGRFLAAEIARDSLGSLALARSLFTSVPSASPLAPKAWIAAAAIAGDSAPAYVSTARERWSGSPYVRALDGREGADGTAFLGDTVLRVTWERVMTTFADSVAARRTAALIATQRP